MKLRIASVALIALLLSVFVVAPLEANAARPTGTAAATITAVDPATGQTVTGTVTDLEATLNQAGDVLISGTFINPAGTATDFTTTLLGGSGSCRILHLELGPLDLDLLGLVVHLDQVVLDITAQQGPGNLLGNLLCAIAGLLDSNTLNTLLVNLLNQLFGLLG